jgi:hypothetical protein
VGYFFSAGQATSTGMGLVALSWQEIRAWRLENRYHLTLWEIETLKQMSDAYASEYSRASDPLRKAPYQVEDEEIIAQKNIAQALSWRDAIRRNGKQKQT